MSVTEICEHIPSLTPSEKMYLLRFIAAQMEEETLRHLIPSERLYEMLYPSEISGDTTALIQVLDEIRESPK